MAIVLSILITAIIAGVMGGSIGYHMKKRDSEFYIPIVIAAMMRILKEDSFGDLLAKVVDEITHPNSHKQSTSIPTSIKDGVVWTAVNPAKEMLNEQSRASATRTAQA